MKKICWYLTDEMQLFKLFYSNFQKKKENYSQKLKLNELGLKVFLLLARAIYLKTTQQRAATRLIKILFIVKSTIRSCSYASTSATGHLHSSQWEPPCSISSHSEHGVAHSLHTDRLHTLHVLRIIISALHSLQIQFEQRSHFTRSSAQISWSQVVHWLSFKQSPQI